MAGMKLIDTLRTKIDEHVRVNQCVRRSTVALLLEGDVPLISFGNGPVARHVCTGMKGACGCAHAEQRLIPWALMNSDALINPNIASWLSPCTSCANLIVIAQGNGLDIKTFYYVDELEHDQAGKRIVRAAGIDIVKLDL